MLWFFLTLVFLLVAAWIFVQSPWGQNWLSRKITARLSRDLNTVVKIDHVDIGLFNRLALSGLLVEDRQKDTLVYAGTVNLRITDWFFIKDKIELKYIGLEDALIRIQRSDSVWRHQFLIDYFASPGTGGGGSGTELDLKKVEMSRVRIEKKDAWLGQDLQLSLAQLSLDARTINFSKKSISIGSLKIDRPDVQLFDYPKKKPTLALQQQNEPAASLDSSLQWNAAGWVLDADLVQIEDGRLRIDKGTKGTQIAWFDGRHIDFSQIKTSLRDIRWKQDTITANLSLATQERSGFVVKSMEALVKLTPREMDFRKMEIQTNNSIIRDSYRMSFDDFSDMNDYIHAVYMQANFVGSEIDSDDIAYFAPALKTWKKNITLNGSVRGTVDELVGRGLEIQAGANTYLNGDISLTGLPDINQTFIDFKANEFRTTYQSAVSIVPAISTVTSPDLRQLASLRFRGSFTGFIRDFVTFGTIETNLGVVTSDLNMKLPEGSPPVYSGTLATDYFRLGQFLKDSSIGAVALKGTVKGRGFQPNDRNTEIDGQILFADYKGYRYQNLQLKGRLDKKLFEGDASIDDPELSLTLNGLINFNDSIPVFDFKANVQNANLQKLKLTKDNIKFAGRARLNLSGDNIDNFLGRAEIMDATLSRNELPLPFDSLVISSSLINDEKTIRLQSNEVDARVSGQFSLRDLPDATRLFLHKYYPAYIPPPKRTPENEVFNFDITTQYVDDYIQMIDTSLYGFNNSHFTGMIDTRSNTLKLDASIPQFKYDGYNFDEVRLSADGNADSLTLLGGASNIRLSDSLNVPLALFRIDASEDRSRVKIYTGANQAINQASINGTVLTYRNGVRIEFDSSSFNINGKSWVIEENGELEFRSNMPASGQLVLKESNQSIRLQTRPSETGDWNDLLVELEKVNLGDISPFLLPRNRLEGLLSGNITLEDPMNNPYLTAKDLRAESLMLDNDSIGDALANLVYDSKQKLLTAQGKTANEENNLAFDLKIHTGSPELQKQNLIQISAKTYPLSILERFLGGLFSDFNGYVTGNFDLTGPLTGINVTGKGRLQNASLKVNFTQCYYRIQDTDLSLLANEINLDGLVLIDSVTQNPVYLRGGIQHEAFRNMFYDLTVSTQKPNTIGSANNKPIQLLHTTVADNKQFYGDVKGTGSFSLIGPQSDLYMKIDAVASSEDSSFVTIPSYVGRESGIADFLVERTYGREMVDSSFSASGSSIIYDVDVTANPLVGVKVILDDLTGDNIEGRGSGTLNIRSGTNEKLSMRGRFDIRQGEYLFTFQSFFKKPFQIREGSENFITWNGDPYAAQIQFDAIYTAEDVSFAPLADLLASGSEFSRHREDVYVVANLRGQLFKPEFSFKLEFSPNGRANSDFSIATAMQQIEKNPNEITRQVSYLIVFNSFAPPDFAPNTGLNTALGEFTNSTISSISGLLFNEINRKLNSELSRILGNDNISINFSGSVYNRNLLNAASNSSIGFNQSNFNVNVPISMFKDRFVVTLGSTLDVPLQSTIQQNVQFLPDVTAEWLINQSGTIRASFFYRQNLDYLTSSNSGAARTRRTGASIAYRREFDSISDFFRKKKKKAQTEAPIAGSDSTKVEKEK